MTETLHDFDAWSDEAEEAAIAAFAETVEVRHIIVEGRVILRLPDQSTLSIPIDVSYEQLEQILEAESSPAAQLQLLLELLGQDGDSQALRKQGLFVVTGVAKRYFDIWQKVRQVTLGESARSSA